MSYSVIQRCNDCTKEPICADGYVIRGAVQGIIHSMSGYNTDGGWIVGMHQGSGTVTHACTNFIDKNPVPGTPVEANT